MLYQNLVIINCTVSFVQISVMCNYMIIIVVDWHLYCIIIASKTQDLAYLQRKSKEHTSSNGLK